MATSNMKPLNDHATGSNKAGGEAKCFECVHSMPDLAKGHARLLSAYQENGRSVRDGAIERFVRVWENEVSSRDTNSVGLDFEQTGDLEAEVGDDETPSEPDFVFRIYTVGIGGNVRYRLCSHDGTIEEDWGLEGIESLLEKHLGGDDGPFHTDYALQFYRKTCELMHGNYIMVADINDESDVTNIRVLWPDREELRYPNRFIFFESSSWCLG